MQSRQGGVKFLLLVMIVLVSASIAFAEDTPNTDTNTAGGESSTTSDPDVPSDSAAPTQETQPAQNTAGTTDVSQPMPAEQPIIPEPVTTPAPQQSEGKVPCPEIASQQYCEFGSKLDANGCPTGECNPAGAPSPLPPKDVPPPEQLPQNCKKIIDESGIERFVCDTPCPNPPPESEMQKCRDNQGIPQTFTDSRGCKIFECKYQGSGIFGGGRQCPSEDERRLISEKCKSNGMRSVMRNDFNGCLIVDCVNEGRKDEMRCPPNEADARIAENCKQNGGRVVPGFDPNGCRISLCEGQENNFGEMQNGPDSDRYIRSGECKEIPKEAFEKCGQNGGNLVVKRDGRGCPTFSECIMRGNERNIQYEEVSEVPDPAVLVSMAFKLENLKIEFDKLSKKTDDIAAYYDSTGKKEDAERFRKASSMFAGAEQRVDEIKSKMKSHVNRMTKEDISEIKHDIKYIREVVMKDILYVMLGGDEVPASSDSEGSSKKTAKYSKNSNGDVDCGTDGYCFNEQLRVCEKAIFYPPSDMGGKTVVRIVGLEGKECVLEAEVSDERTGSAIADMACKFPDYVMGMKGPEELMPYCKGSMADYFKRFGGGARPGVANSRNIERPPRTNDDYPERRFVEPDNAEPFRDEEYRRPVPQEGFGRPVEYVEPEYIEQPDREFPQEIAPIGHLLKQFAII